MSVESGGVGDSGWLIDTANDTILITAASSQVGESLTINYRFIRKDTGAVIVDSQILSLAAGDRSIKQVVYPFQGNPRFEPICDQDIYLTDVSIQADIATTRGQTFARVNLVRQTQGANASVAPTKCAILSDYVTQQVSACLRNARHFTSIEGPGWLLTIQVAALGLNNWALNVPVNARWKVICITDANLTTGAGGANRIPYIQFYEPGGVRAWYAAPPAVVPPASGIGLQVGTKTHSLDAGGTAYLPLPDDFVLLPGGIISSLVINGGVNDVWNNLSVSMEEWLDNV